MYCAKKFFMLMLAAVMLVTCAACGAVDKKISESTVDERQVEILNLTTKKVRLNSGYDMPVIGLGTYALSYDACVNSVMTLIKNGGRLIDTAYMYGNEDAVGEGVRRDTASSAKKFLSSRKFIRINFQTPNRRLNLRFQNLILNISI